MAAGIMISLQGCGSKEEVMEEPIREPEIMAETSALSGEDVPLAEMSDDAIYIEPLGGEFQDIHFEFDQYRILDRDIATLERISRWLNNNPQATVLIEGHCDERGTNEYNMALGEQRALAARRYLIGLGIDSDRLHTISYGEERPIALGSNEEAWGQNRRGHFAVSM
ncbi:MAG: peptidoglycan-associated lipoprotein Pal [Candidatus Eisenbacteria bacterium]|nr:peptidoglycan-associated lipoprotein Pal [Candidatus Eisenbacteria bacterium]